MRGGMMFKERKIVCVIGRDEDWKELRIAEQQETFKGHIVVGPSCLGVMPANGPVHTVIGKRGCYQLTLDKIELADEVVHVVNVQNIVTSDVEQILNVAISIGKPIRKMFTYETLYYQEYK